MTEILIDGNSLDLYASEKVTLTRQIGSSFDLKDRRTDYTNKFTVPNTARNNQIMDSIAVSGVASQYQWIAHDVVVIESGIEIVSNGIGLIESLGRKGFSISVRDGSINLFDTLKGKKLSELDFSTLDHTLDEATWLANIDNDYTSGFGYPLADWGAFFNPSNGNYRHYWNRQAPVLYVHWVWDQIMTDANILYSGDIFSDADYLKTWISPKEGFETETTGDVDALNVEFTGQIAVTSGQSPNPYFIDSNTLFIPNIIVSSIIGFDNNGVTLTCQETGNYKFSNVSEITYIGFPALVTDPDLVIIKNGSVSAKVAEGSDITIAVQSGDVLSFGSSIDWDNTTPSQPDGTTLASYYASLPSTHGFTLSHEIEIYRDYQNVPISFAAMFGDIDKAKFVKDVIRMYALQFQFIDGVYVFETTQDIYGGEIDPLEIAGEVVTVDKRIWTNNLAKTNRLEWSYKEDTGGGFANKDIYLSNDHYSNDVKTIFKMPYLAMSSSYLNAGQYISKPHLWEFDTDSVGFPPIDAGGHYYGKSEDDTISFNYQDVDEVNPLIAYNGSYKRASFEGLDFDSLFNEYYSEWANVMATYEEIELTIKISVYNLMEFKFMKPYYIPSLGEFVVFDKIGAWRKDKLTKAKAVIVRGITTALPPEGEGIYTTEYEVAYE